ncbi:type IV pilus biogenesis/stability protein PilW [Cognatiluteimonas profundi]|uniref:type IV pilus biogenesis/stability protein PilW n=1 Tax=Cognatiluteimonas profundi TaxID=2594501 RepID=UPI00131E115F|nr:type IV pilus biogenesis/stability protein PilW [Lysobacter profundi]
MRLLERIALLLLVTLAAGSCSRLTFVKPNLKRHNYQQVTPDYNIRDDPRDAQRVAAIDHVAVAEQHLGAGQLDEAQTEVQAALKSDPKSVNAYILMGMIAEQRGNNAAAGGYYAKAVALAPTRGTALNNYGAWLCGNGRAAESLAMFDRTLADPEYRTPAGALANAGSCAITAGQDQAAARYLQGALQMDPASPVALAAMASLQFKQGNYLQARAFSERRLSVAPASVTVLQLASQIEQKLGDTAAAARYVQRIGQEFPQARPVSPGDASQR